MDTIQLVNVSKTFGNMQVLDGINLDIKKGEFVSIVGPSGCGKTTLLRIVAGLEKADTGEILISGEIPLQACKKRQVGVAFQRPALLASRTALQNVALTLEITGHKDSMSPEKLLSDFGLDRFTDHYPHQLSGGMQQRVNIATSMVHNPEYLFLDEPFGALDELTRENLAEWLSLILFGRQKTVLFITHSIEEAVFLSDRVILMSPRPGRICEENTFLINLPKPRIRAIRAQEEFLRRVGNIREALYSMVNGGET